MNNRRKGFLVLAPWVIAVLAALGIPFFRIEIARAPVDKENILWEWIAEEFAWLTAINAPLIFIGMAAVPNRELQA